MWNNAYSYNKKKIKPLMKAHYKVSYALLLYASS